MTSSQAACKLFKIQFKESFWYFVPLILNECLIPIYLNFPLSKNSKHWVAPMMRKCFINKPDSPFTLFSLGRTPKDEISFLLTVSLRRKFPSIYSTHSEMQYLLRSVADVIKLFLEEISISPKLRN